LFWGTLWTRLIPSKTLRENRVDSVSTIIDFIEPQELITIKTELSTDSELIRASS
jgi:hypothetical protein